jgi:hypothetical protein
LPHHRFGRATVNVATDPHAPTALVSLNDMMAKVASMRLAAEMMRTVLFPAADA